MNLLPGRKVWAWALGPEDQELLTVLGLRWFGIWGRLGSKEPCRM